ncbi:MAG: DUF3365 domain-containing protein [Saprospiraceae bacterium]|nr:DUF3365 domain-containing protein [Saprospiraceae bacterium]
MKTQIAFFCAVSVALFYCCKGSTIKDKETPSTLHSHSNQDTTPGIDVDYLAMGQRIVTEAQAVLAKNLMGAIGEGGSVHALEFCNSKASLLTDSMSRVLNSSIKRVSDKPRNPGNLATELELAHILSLKDQMGKGEAPAGEVHTIDDKIIGLYPIVTNAMCLQCHGKKNTDINTATLRKIQKLYPGDKATGYEINELRGLWVVEMNKK